MSAYIHQARPASKPSDSEARAHGNGRHGPTTRLERSRGATAGTPARQWPEVSGIVSRCGGCAGQSDSERPQPARGPGDRCGTDRGRLRRFPTRRPAPPPHPRRGLGAAAPVWRTRPATSESQGTRIRVPGTRMWWPVRQGRLGRRHLLSGRVVRIANRANREAPKSGDSRRIARRSIKSRIARIVV